MKSPDLSAAFSPSPNPVRGVLGVLWLTFFLNLVLCLGKLIVGLAVNSLSMMADGFHSLMDAFANVVGLISVFIASKPADEDHPYGHRKFEVLAALGIALFMGVSCVEILESVYHRFHQVESIPNPNPLAFGVMLVTMSINAWLSWYEAKKGREFQSSVLAADSAHTGSDTLASASVLAALVGAKMGLAWVDLAASVLVVLIVARVAYRIVNQALQVLSDRIMVDPGKVASVVKSVPGIIACHKVRSRGMPGNVFVDLHIQVSPRLTTLKSHALTHKVMATVKEAIPGVTEVFVHTEPAKPEDYSKLALSRKPSRR
ncbi:MAG TPA: cation diffusion facilitator family transporter [bacterium]